MRLIYSTVQSLATDEQDPDSLVIRLVGVPGLTSPSLRIAREQIDGFLAIVGFDKEADLVGSGVRITVDDDQGTEHVAFLTKAEEAEAAAALALAPAEPAEPVAVGQSIEVAPEAAEPVAVGQSIEVAPEAAEPVAVGQSIEVAPEPAEPVAVGQSIEVAPEPAEPVAVGQSIEVAPEPAEPVAVFAPAQAAAPLVEFPDISRGIAVMAGSVPADAITVYDDIGAAFDPAIAPIHRPAAAVAASAAEEPCEDDAASLTPAEQAIEEGARAELASASAAPLEQRYFLYRESYDQGPRQSVVELTPEEFALLGGSGAYLHVDDCTVIRAQALSPDAVQGIEHLLERATSRPEAGLPRADLERLTIAGHVVSIAVY